MPDRWHRKLSAVRSAMRMLAQRPGDGGHRLAGDDPVAVVGPPVEVDEGVDLEERLGGGQPPGQHAHLAGDEVGRGRGARPAGGTW